jgi:hypothetical protein
MELSRASLKRLSQKNCSCSSILEAMMSTVTLFEAELYWDRKVATEQWNDDAENGHQRSADYKDTESNYSKGLHLNGAFDLSGPG